MPLRLGTSPGRLRLTIAARGFHDSVIPASLINPYQFGYASGSFQGAVRRWITCGPAVSGPHVAMRGTCGPHLRLGPGRHPLFLQAGVEEALGHVVTFRILDSETFPWTLWKRHAPAFWATLSGLLPSTTTVRQEI